MLLSEYHRDPQLSPLKTLILYQRAINRKEDDRFYQRWLIAIQNKTTKDSYEDFKRKAISKSTPGLTIQEEQELEELLSLFKRDKIMFEKKK